MTTDPWLDALTNLDRPITPSPQAAEAIRDRIDAAIAADLEAASATTPIDVVTDVSASDASSGSSDLAPLAGRWRRIPAVIGIAAACLAIALLVARGPEPSDVGIATAPETQQVLGQSLCDRSFDRYVDVWQEVSSGTSAGVAGEPPYTAQQYGALVAAQDEWLKAAERSLAQSPALFTGNGRVAIERAIEDLAATKYSFDILLSGTTNPPNLAGSIRQTHLAIIAVIDAEPNLLADCDSQRLTLLLD